MSFILAMVGQLIVFGQSDRRYAPWWRFRISIPGNTRDSADSCSSLTAVSIYLYFSTPQ